MKTRKLAVSWTLCASLSICPVVLATTPFESFAAGDTSRVSQNGNTISGYVFGLNRQPLYDVNVELMDDFSRMIARTKTDASGRYFFSRISSGRFRVRVLPYGLGYEEQEGDIEIQNFSREVSGRVVTSGFDNAQKDFYLRQKNTNQPSGRSEAIFVQEVPKEARESYMRAINLLDGKKEEQGLKELKASIEAFPNYFDAIERLGNEYVRLKHYEAARILLSRAIEINPRSYKGWYGRAYALYSLNMNKEALEAGEKSFSLNQNSAEAALLNGVLSKKAGQFKEAEKHLKKAKELSKGEIPEVNWQLALLYGNNLKRYKEAADELELFLKAKPDSSEAENIKKLIKQFREKAQQKS